MKSNALKITPRGKPARPGWLLTLVTLTALVSLLVAPAGVQARAPQVDLEWTTQRADAPKMFYNMGNHSFVVDETGAGHVVYGGDHLYYARFANGAYQVTTVDSDQAVGQFASLALDHQNRPHISYYDAYNGNLKYAYHNGTQWFIRVVDTAPPVNEAEAELPSEIDVQADPRPGFDPAFQPEGLDGATQSVQNHKGGVGMYSSITIDSRNRPHISYYDAVNRNLKYAYLDTSTNPATWVVDTVNRGFLGNDYGTWTSIVTLDVGNQTVPLISFMDETLDDLKFITGKVGDWEEVETVDGGDIKGGYSSIALDKNNNIYISYYACGERTSETNFACSKGDLKIARRKAGQWTSAVVHSRDNIGGWTSLTIDEDNRAHISYYSFTDMDLWYAYSETDIAAGGNVSGVRWNTSRLASNGDVGRYTSISTFKADKDHIFPHITYLDLDAGKLVETYRAIDPNDKKEKWFFRDIDRMADVGYSTSIQFKSNGDPLISYFDNATKDLKLTKLEGGRWMDPPLTLATTGTMGWDTSLKINRQDQARIAHYDATKGNLMYTLFDGSQWRSYPITSVGDVGRYPSLALNSLDVPRISYYDATAGNGNLMLASWDVSAGRWVTETVDTGGDTNTISYNVGQFTSMQIDSRGFPHISYFDVSRGALRYSSWDETLGRWFNQVVEDDTDDVNPSVMGQYTSLALDGNDVPHISYYECGVVREHGCDKGDLKHAWRVWNGSQFVWETETVDTGGDAPGSMVDVGLYSSLVISGSRMYISYYDATNQDLKVAFHDGSRWKIYTVDSAGDVGRYSSIALDASGNPYISYYDATNGDLKVASARVITTEIPPNARLYYIPFLGK